VKIFHDNGIDTISELLIPLDNYISRGTEAFLSLEGGQYPNVIFNMYKTVMTDTNASDGQCVDGAKLIQVLLIYCKGRVDSLVPAIIEVAATRLNTAKKPALKVILMEVIADSLIYNPLLTLSLLESRQWTRPVFTLWFELVPKFARIYDKKVCILGLTALLSVPFEQLPQILKVGMKQIMEAVINTQLALDKQQKEWEEQQAEMKKQEDELDDDFEDEIDLDDDQDGQSLQQLAKEAREFLERDGEDEDQEGEEAGDDDDDDDDLEEELGEEGDFVSPYDDLDSCIVFVEKLQGLLSSPQASVFQPILQQLDAPTQASLQQLFQSVEPRKLKKQQEEQEAQAQLQQNKQ